MQSAPLIVDVRSYIAQFVPWDIPLPISPEDVKWVVVPITVTVGGSNQDDQDSDWNGPANFYSLILGIEAHVGMNDVSTESVAISGLGNPSVDERMLAKAQNYKVSFENTDRSGGMKIFDGPIRLSSLLPGKWLPVPVIVPKAETLKVTIDTVDEAADITGGSTDIGLDLWILQVRCGK